MPVTLSRPQLMKWAGTIVTDHNRSPLSVSVERIENKQRMADGTMRKYVIADKRTWTCSWEWLPTSDAKTVDGKMGGTAMETFYNSNPGAFALQLYMGDGTSTTYQVMFSDFSKEVVKRGTVDFLTINVTLEEV
jgi:hypothetical protein